VLCLFLAFAANFSFAPDVSFRDEAEVRRTAEYAASVANDPKATSITLNAFDRTVGRAAVLPHDRHRRAL
jgi:hypothetical protein